MEKKSDKDENKSCMLAKQFSRFNILFPILFNATQSIEDDQI